MTPGAIPAANSTETSGDNEAVVATVGGEPIYAREVERALGTVTRGQQVSPAALPLIRAQVLEEIVNRRLVLAYARHTKSSASKAEVEAAVNELKAKLASQKRSLEEYLKAESLSEAELRRKITWNLVWNRYLAKYLTDGRLQSYFRDHRRDFDGSEVSVSHILLPRQANDGPQAMDALVQRANAIREEITTGKTSFADAATKYSAGPSAKDDGKLGFITRHGTMVGPFARAGFALEVGQVSQPVKTPFGIHLICCDEIKPGTKQWTEVRAELEEALAGELLARISQIERRHTPVELTKP
jgi:parvulin-like peptidyl-prolyl isomerase